MNVFLEPIILQFNYLLLKSNNKFFHRVDIIHHSVYGICHIICSRFVRYIDKVGLTQTKIFFIILQPIVNNIYSIIHKTIELLYFGFSITISQLVVYVVIKATMRPIITLIYVLTYIFCQRYRLKTIWTELWDEQCL